MNLTRKMLAEFIGTMILVLLACGTAVATKCSVDNPASYMATAVAFGLTIVAMAYSICNVSGCHINPAVSFAMLLRRKLRIGEFFGYVIAQSLGAIAGASLLGILFGFDCGFGANVVQEGYTVGIGFLAEAVLTFVFVLVIFGVTARKENDNASGLVIGAALALVHLLGIAVTGTSVNPARSLGPALFAGGEALRQLWIFICAPLVGALCAAILSGAILNGKRK